MLRGDLNAVNCFAAVRYPCTSVARTRMIVRKGERRNSIGEHQRRRRPRAVFNEPKSRLASLACYEKDTRSHMNPDDSSCAVIYALPMIRACSLRVYGRGSSECISRYPDRAAIRASDYHFPSCIPAANSVDGKRRTRYFRLARS